MVFINALEYIVTKKIETMYFGHGEPLKVNCKKNTFEFSWKRKESKSIVQKNAKRKKQEVD